MMPVMDGYSLIKSAAKIPCRCVVTAKSQPESLEEAFTLGVDDYMVKPIRLESWRCVVQGVTRKSAVGNRKSYVFHIRTHLQCVNVTDLETDTVYQIPKKEFYVLYKLLGNPEKILRVWTLLDDIWGMEEDLDERWWMRALNGFARSLKDNPGL